jgi:alkylated DNA repair protein alkB homolog 6
MDRDTLPGISELKLDDNLDPTSIVNWSLLSDTAAFSSGSAERTTRVSLTYRDVLKVAKLGGALKFINKR